MITWMQRHKKWLIITIWISTIAFVGAGFVGWGQYSYGDKAGAVAKVGDVEISMGDLQKTYSNLYNQYARIFQGNFDEEKAKSFGLKKQAMVQLTQQALVLNLAKSYSLKVSDKELLDEIKTQKYFFKDGVFNKEVYKSVLSKNNLSIKEYENDVRKELLIKKTLKLLPVKADKSEYKILDTLISIADKIDYKVLSKDDVEVNVTDDALKTFWEGKKQNFMTIVSYEVQYIKQPKLDKKYDDKKLHEYYKDNRTHFKDKDGKILDFEKAKIAVEEELNSKDTKKEALRSYIAFKKDKLDSSTKVKNTTISSTNNPFNLDVLEKVSSLDMTSPFLKPVLVDGEYYIFKLIKTNPSKVKSFEDAKNEVLPLYIAEKKRTKLLELAKNSLASFKGITTDFITRDDIDKIEKLSKEQSKEFLAALFDSQDKKGFINLNDGNIVLYNILEQKLLSKTNTDSDEQILRIKSAMFNEGLIKNLQNKYKTEIFIQGL